MPTDDCFKVVKEDMKRRLKNTNMKPLSHSSYLRLQVLCQIFYDADEKLHVLDELSISDLKSFIPELCSQIHYTNVPIFVIGCYYQFVKLKFLTSSSSRLYIGGLCHGNLLEDEAITLSNIFKSNFSVPPLPIKLRHEEYVICLPPGANLIRDSNVKNKSETNSVIEVTQNGTFSFWFPFMKVYYLCLYYDILPLVVVSYCSCFFQVEQEAGIESIRLKALIDLFDEIVEEPLFNQLRTKEKLGYVVECDPRETKTFVIRARETDPRLEATKQIIAVADTLLAAESQINNQNQQPDWYAILQLAQYTQNLEIVATQYRRLALLLNPHRNRFPDYAFRLVSEAWNVLSNPTKKAMYDHELSMFNRFDSPSSGSTQLFERRYYRFISRYYR
ncbi:hypothetical protein ACFX1S_003075 [Malus domestica]